MTENIKTFELYHIGTKLKNIVNLEILEDKITDILKQKNYDVQEKPKSLTLGPLSVDTIALKDKVKIQVNFIANALNVISDSQKNTFEIFEELISILQNLDYGPNFVIEFHEILGDILLKTKDSPQDIMNNITRVESKIIKELGYEINNKGLRLGYESLDKKDIIDFLIEPNPLNPEESLHLKVLFRTQNRKKLKDFHEKIENIINDVLKSIGV